MTELPFCGWDRADSLRRLQAMVRVLTAILLVSPKREEELRKRISECEELMRKLENSSE